MFVNYLKVEMRYRIKYELYSFINIPSLVMGKGLRFTFAVVLNILLCISVALAQDGVEKAKSLFDARKYDAAKTAFEQILATDSENSEVHYFLGRLHFHYGDYNKAKDHLELAVEVDKTNVDYHLWLGTVYRDKARTSSFLAAAKWARRWKGELEKAFEIDPTNLDARERLIGYLVNAPGIGGGDKDKGKKLAEETIVLEEIQGRLLLAYAYRRMKKMDLALAEYKKVLASEPQNGRVYRGLGYLFLSQKNYQEAESNFRNYIKVAADDADAYDSLGDYFLKRDMRDPAIVQLQKAIEVDPEFSASRFKLAQAYDKKGMPKKAFHHYEKLVELTPGYYKAKDARKRLKKLRGKIAAKGK